MPCDNGPSRLCPVRCPVRTCLYVLFPLTAVGLAFGHGAAQEKARIAFRTETVKRGTVVTAVRASGTLQPEEAVDVGAQVSGRIEKFGTDPRDATKTIDFGTPVEAGTVLAQLDPSPYRNQLDQARGR